MDQQSYITLANLESGLPEVFFSLQGEGPETGRPSIFIRTSGCNLYCYWCDTPYTWNWEGVKYAHESNHRYKKAKEQSRFSIQELANIVSGMDCQHIVFTGGEPMVQAKQLVELARALKDTANYEFDIETNATIRPDDDLDSIVTRFVCSPKLANSRVPEELRIKPEVMIWFARSEKSYFKFVVETEQDMAEVLSLVEKFKIRSDRVYLMCRAIDSKELTKNQDFVNQQCAKYGFLYSDRLHLKLYGNGRGV